MRYYVGITSVFCLCAALAACTVTDRGYRRLSTQNEACAGVVALSERNTEGKALEVGAQTLRASDDDYPLNCYFQSHRLPGVGAWQQQAEAVGKVVADVDRFDLAFVEISDQGQLHDAAQLSTLLERLRQNDRDGRQNFVVTYVHGWRHDAVLRDRDLQKFRILLGYSRAALNARCIDGGDYCNARLTGVFIGWRGRAFAEPPLTSDFGVTPFVAGALPTIFNRKTKSDDLGRGRESVLGQVLKAVEYPLALKQGDPRADKLLIVGHSLGGNMLSGVAEDYALDAIAKQRLPSRNGDDAPVMKPFLGDLVVLLNPAAEAAKWTSLQRAMRQRAGLRDDEFQIVGNVGGYDPVFRKRVRPWRLMFPLHQRPVYISITATANWFQNAQNSREVRSDFATSTLFPITRSLIGKKGAEETKAIGHLVPTYSKAPDNPRPLSQVERGRAQPREILVGPPIGATHEMSVNDSGGAPASYGNSTVPDLSWCSAANGWLYQARRAKKALNGGGVNATDAGWEYGLERAPDGPLQAMPNIAVGHNAASVQWRHALYLRGRENRASVASSRSPFWNVRAYDTAVKEHAGWVSYPMWCAINQLVLDDVTYRGRPDEIVAEVIEEQIEEEKAVRALNP
ncbi:hypothetical protein [Thalassovita taeanensis]|uniref:Alpha/beta hydrolase family protein n=1 Tax=Thalassovita taeanensis TaxID=657014 RepID=A0A1H9J3T4_9RHOB|nr:hypothetical protein [Thalassovita taeanensis]SEQ81691.1 hypothetical protein SAMN04488092_1147 [Thalassovita taeanensis]